MLRKLRSIFGSKPASDPRELFAAEVESFIRSLPNVKKVMRATDAFAFEVTRASGSTAVMFLDNAFAESREMSPEQRFEKIAMFFGLVGSEEPVETWEEAREMFVPVIRGATYGIGSWTKEPGATSLRRPFLPYLDQQVAIDRPTAMRFVGRSHVQRWSVKEHEVFEAAAARVPLLAGASVELYDDVHGPLWIVTSNDSYESSRLLVPGWLASFRGRVEGNPIAIIPERATLMIGGDARPEMIERLLDKADREFAASNRRLSPALYAANNDGAVVPYARPVGDPLAAKVRVGHEKLAMYEYTQQKEVLDAVYEKNGPSVFVASYRVFATDGGGDVSLSVWTKGARAYLPRTERVMLMVLADQKGAKPKAAIEVPFEAIANRLTAVPDLHPARYETTGEFPSDAELRALAEAREAWKAEERNGAVKPAR
jgi:hypothetical protein